MLSTTVDDLRDFADFVDRLTGHNHVFAVPGSTAEDSAQFEFGCYVDANPLK